MVHNWCPQMPTWHLVAEQHLPLVSLQMEDGHTLFDYEVRLNDTIQLLVRQSLVLPHSAKERDSELSDTDSGCCLGQSESDKSSTHGEAAAETDSRPADEDMWDETELGLYKVRLPSAAALGLDILPAILIFAYPAPTGGASHVPLQLWLGRNGQGVVSCTFPEGNTVPWASFVDL